MERLITPALIEAFENTLRDDEKSENTITKYMRDLRRFTGFVAEKPISKALTLAYKAELEKRYTPASTNSMLAALNSFLRYAEWHDCCVKPFKMQKKTYCSEDMELTKAEYVALVRAAEEKRRERLSLLLQTICGTGIRVSEVSHITVETVMKGEAVVSCKGKTRTIFIVSALRKKLLKYAAEQGIEAGMIFVSKSGKPLNRSNIWRDMKSLCKEAGVSPGKVFPHNFRHLFARTFYRGEKDIAQLADILGHSNINTTRIYTISTGAEHKRRMEKMNLVL